MGTCGIICPTPYCNKGMCTQCDNTVLLLGDANTATNQAFVNKANAAGLSKFTLTQNGHPIWTNLPNTFTGTANQGCQVGNLTNNGTQIAAINSPCSGPGVVVRSSPGGRMVYLAHAAGYSSATGWVNDTNMVNMTINAIKWATGCLL